MCAYFDKSVNLELKINSFWNIISLQITHWKVSNFAVKKSISCRTVTSLLGTGSRVPLNRENYWKIWKHYTPFQWRTKLIFSYRFTVFLKISVLSLKCFNFWIAFENCLLRSKCNCQFFYTKWWKYITFCHWEWGKFLAPLWGERQPLIVGNPTEKHLYTCINYQRNKIFILSS